MLLPLASAEETTVARVVKKMRVVWAVLLPLILLAAGISYYASIVAGSEEPASSAAAKAAQPTAAPSPGENAGKGGAAVSFGSGWKA